MARLNEPPVESVESLKRRFIRQNRELARNNSTQSVKIRNLETHISQLAAENVSLRAHIIQLQNELDNREHLGNARTVDAVRQKLEDKLVEFHDLISQLNVGKTAARSSRKSTSAKSPKRSPVAQKLWTERRGEMMDAVGGREGWLPTIAEGKQFPRKTLDTSDLQTLISNQSSESPDIGPPPRSSVDSPDRSKQVAPVSETEAAPIDENSLSGLFSVNLESRRKRRETNVRRDTPTSTTESESPAKEQDKPIDLWNAQPVRAGSKRKLDAAYRPATNENAPIRGKDELTLKANTTTVDEANNISPTRRALAPKSVNNDPVVSPKKPTSQDSQPELVSNKPLPKPSRSRRSSQSLQKQVEALDLGQDVGTSPITSKTEPKTPAPPLDLFSPESLEHSDIRPEGRGDTPPPLDLSRRGTVVGAEEASAGRTSRRARAGVNYAEPNLISKMRRPTKDLVDAVNQNKNRSSTTPASDAKIKPNEELESRRDSKRTVMIKSSQARESTNNNSVPSNDPSDPQSPLVAREDSSQALSLERATDRRTELNAQKKIPDTVVDSARQAPLEAEIPKTTRPRQSRVEKVLTDSSSAPSKKEGEPDIFDVGPSPPRRAFTVSKSKAEPAESETRPSLTNAGRSTSGTNLSSRPRSTQSSTPSTTSSSALHRARSRRQTVGTGIGSSANRNDKAEPPSGPVSTEVPTAAKTSSTFRSGSKEDNEAIDTKITSRRRSMMV